MLYSLCIPTCGEVTLASAIADLVAAIKFASLSNDVEILVFFDGPPQNFANYEIENVPIRVNRSSLRRGKAYALNELSKLAQGDYLIFVDADVRIPTNALEQIESFRIREDFDLAYCRPMCKRESRYWTTFNRVLALGWRKLRKSKDYLFSASGNLLILRKKNFHGIPQGIINDDAFLGDKTEKSQGKICYISNVPITHSGATTFRDILSQQIRIKLGRLLNDKYFNSTKHLMLEFKIICFHMALAKTCSLIGKFTMCLFIVIHMIALIGAVTLVLGNGPNHNIWKIAWSTKR